MTRSVWKGPFLAPCFFRKKYNNSTIKGSSIETFSRGSVIMPQFVGTKVGIHNGHKFIMITVKEEMVGHKFGEFSFTKKKPIHKKKTKTR